MKNAFQDIEPADELPEEVKGQTLSNVYTLRLVLDVLDLFIVKAGAALGDSLAGTQEERRPPGQDEYE